ncbi:hypothetical protein H0X06_01075 [Candidatus Dependentiae bacterium]|nr:hypothetical protein [Candidatus Dependentiae bacterium]
MNFSTRKLPLLAVTILVLLGVNTHSMQQTDSLSEKNDIGAMIFYLRELPQDLKNYIVFLVLEKTLNYNFELSQTFSCPTQDRVLSVALNSDGKTALTGSSDGRARLWDIQTGDLLKTLIIGPWDKESCLWNIPKIVEQRDEDKVLVEVVTFSPDGTIALTACEDDTACLWDILTGEKLRTLRGGNGWICFAAFSPDGTTIFTGSKEGTKCLWDTFTGKLLRVDEGKSYSSCIMSAAFYSVEPNIILIGTKGGECISGIPKQEKMMKYSRAN